MRYRVPPPNSVEVSRWSTLEGVSLALRPGWRASDLGDVTRTLRHVTRRPEFKGAELWFESGRYLLASAGTLLATVTDVKISRGRTYVLLDTGIHHLAGMSGLRRILRPAISLRRVGAEAGDDAQAFDLAGPLCTPLDCLARGLEGSLPDVGDVVAIPNVGAYGLTASLVGFLSRPAPTEVVCRGESVLAAYRWRTGHEELKLPLAGAELESA